MSTKKNNLPKPKPKPVTNSDAMPSIGGDASSEYLKMFYPKPEKDMKWSYLMLVNIQGIKVNAELTMEVIEIENKKVKIRTIMGDQSFDSETSVDAFSPLPTPSSGANKSGFIFEGNEDISVPSGDFRGCVKLSTFSEGVKTYIWLYKGTGPVKFSITLNGLPADLLLSEFKN